MSKSMRSISTKLNKADSQLVATALCCKVVYPQSDVVACWYDQEVLTIQSRRILNVVVVVGVVIHWIAVTSIPWTINPRSMSIRP